MTRSRKIHPSLIKEMQSVSGHRTEVIRPFDEVVAEFQEYNALKGLSKWTVARKN